jgi:hypothetical protein
MKTLFFILCFAVSAIAQTDSVYCIQIMSTKNIHLVRAEHLSMSTLDTAYVEQVGQYYRILIPYSTYDEAFFMLTTWQRAHKDAFITVRCRKHFNQHCKPFYTTR